MLAINLKPLVGQHTSAGATSMPFPAVSAMIERVRSWERLIFTPLILEQHLGRDINATWSSKYTKTTNLDIIQELDDVMQELTSYKGGVKYM